MGEALKEEGRRNRVESRNEFLGFTEFASYSERDRQKVVTILVTAKKGKVTNFTTSELPKDSRALDYLINELKVDYSRRKNVILNENGISLEPRARRKKQS